MPITDPPSSRSVIVSSAAPGHDNVEEETPVSIASLRSKFDNLAGGKGGVETGQSARRGAAAGVSQQGSSDGRKVAGRDAINLLPEAEISVSSITLLRVKLIDDEVRPRPLRGVVSPAPVLHRRR